MMPLEKSARRTASVILGAELKVFENAAHGLFLYREGSAEQRSVWLHLAPGS
jgi:hypothetical protein